MKIYIATPITNRPEATMEERLKAAKERVEQISQYMREERPSEQGAGDPLRTAEYCSTFDVNPIGCNHTEAEAMGNCIRLLLECDAILLDKGVSVHSIRDGRRTLHSQRLFQKCFLFLAGDNTNTFLQTK